MAARMHNLRISSDHSYPVNIVQNVTANRMVDTIESRILEDDDDDSDDDEVKNTDATQK